VLLVHLFRQELGGGETKSVAHVLVLIQQLEPKVFPGANIDASELGFLDACVTVFEASGEAGRLA